MNIQDLLNALSGLDQRVGLGPQPTPPPMAPPSSPLAALLNLRSATPGSIHDWMTQGQPGADYRQATGDFASDQLAAGADPSLPPLAQLLQQSMAAAQGNGPPPVPSSPAAPPPDPSSGSFGGDLMAALKGVYQQAPNVLSGIGQNAPAIGSDLGALAGQAANASGATD